MLCLDSKENGQFFCWLDNTGASGCCIVYIKMEWNRHWCTDVLMQFMKSFGMTLNLESNVQWVHTKYEVKFCWINNKLSLHSICSDTILWSINRRKLYGSVMQYNVTSSASNVSIMVTSGVLQTVGTLQLVTSQNYGPEPVQLLFAMNTTSNSWCEKCTSLQQLKDKI
jgi:hypothetical protein